LRPNRGLRELTPDYSVYEAPVRLAQNYAATSLGLYLLEFACLAWYSICNYPPLIGIVIYLLSGKVLVLILTAFLQMRATPYVGAEKILQLFYKAASGHKARKEYFSAFLVPNVYASYNIVLATTIQCD